jgi:hypothetical protein
MKNTHANNSQIDFGIISSEVKNLLESWSTP